MAKTLESISRTVAGKLETVELAGQPEMAKQEIQRLKEKLQRFYELLPWLTEDQKEKIQVIRKAWIAWQNDNGPKVADAEFTYKNLVREEAEALLKALRAEEKIIKTPSSN